MPIGIYFQMSNHVKGQSHQAQLAKRWRKKIEIQSMDDGRAAVWRRAEQEAVIIFENILYLKPKYPPGGGVWAGSAKSAVPTTYNCSIATMALFSVRDIKQSKAEIEAQAKASVPIK